MDRQTHPHFAASAPVSRAPSVHGEPNSQTHSPRHSTEISSHFPSFWKAARHKTYGREIPHPDSPTVQLPFLPSGTAHITFPSGKPRPLVMGLGRPMPTPEEKQAYINSRYAWAHSQKNLPKSGNLSPIARHISLPTRSPTTAADSADSPSSPYVVVTPEVLAQIAPEWIREQANAQALIKDDKDVEKSEDSDKITPLHTEPNAIQVIKTKDDTTAVSEIVEQEVEAIDFPNSWARIRYNMREPFAEFMGTMFLILFGNGVNNQVFLTSNPDVSSTQQGSYLSISWGWGLGVCMGVYVAGGISGGHINPAVTLSLAIFRGFPWRKVPIYWAAQLLGAFAGACIIFGLYQNAIDVYEGGANIRTIQGDHGTAQLFSTYPQLYLSNVSAFFQEFTDTAILLIVILALGDRNNTPPPDGLNPVVLLFLILGIGACLGTQTAYAVNPARDLGPRLMTYCMGYGTEVWNYRGVCDYTTPVIATLIGGIFGSFLYDALIYTGTDSPLNRRWEKGPFTRFLKRRQENPTTIKAHAKV